MKFLDSYGNDVDSNMYNRERPAYEVDTATSGTTYIRYDNRAKTLIKKIVDSSSTITTYIAYGNWADRATITDWHGVNEHIAASDL